MDNDQRRKMNRAFSTRGKQGVLDLLNRMPGGVGILRLYNDRHIERVFMNDQVYSILGTSPNREHAYDSDKLLEMVHPEDRKSILDEMTNSVLEQRTGEINVRLNSLDRGYRWFSVKSTIADVGEEYTELYISLSDIDDFIRAEHRAKEFSRSMEARQKIEQERIEKDKSAFTGYVVSDITDDIIIDHSNHAPNAPIIDSTNSYSANIRKSLESVVYDDDRETFDKMHDIKYLISEYEAGHNYKRFEFRRRWPDGLIGWSSNELHLLEDPETEHITLYEYCNDINGSKSVEVVTYAAILQTFECLASIDVIHKQTTYLSQHSIRQGKNVILADYPETIAKYIGNTVLPGYRADCEKYFDVDYIKARLEKEDSYEITFSIMTEDQKVHIMRDKYTYYDKKKFRCLLMRTDVTDLVEQENKERHRLQLAQVMDEIPGGLVILDSVKDEAGRHRILFCAQGVAMLTGYDVDTFVDLYHNHMDKLIFRSDIAAVAAQMDRLELTSCPLDIAYRVIHKDGHLFWIREAAKIMKDKDGKNVIVAVFQNVSEDTRLYQEIIDNSDNLVHVIDSETREIYYANAASCRLTGIDNYAGMHCYEYFANKTKPCDVCNYVNDRFCNKEMTFKKYSKVFSANVSNSVWHGRKVFNEILIDITNHKKMQNHYDSYISAITESINDAGITGRINVTQNRCMSIISKYESFKSDERTVTIDEFCRYAANFIKDPDEKKDYLTKFSRDNLINEYNNGNNIVDTQQDFMLSSGMLVIMKSVVQMTLNPETGDIEGVLYSRDVTQEAVNDEIFKTLLSDRYEGVELINVLSGSCSIRRADMHDRDLKYVENDSDDYENSCKDVAEKYIHPDDVELFMNNACVANLVKQLDDNQVYSFTVRNLVDGKITVKTCNYCYIGTGKNTILATIEDVTDIVSETERQKEEIQKALKLAEQSAKAKSEFLSLMSHDMRTPLNGILGLSYLMKEEKDETRMRSYIPKLRDSGEYLLRLINDILDITKVESGKMTINPRPCDTKELFDSVIDMVAPMVQAKHQIFHFRPADVKWGSIYADEQRVKQIFINVISNSIKYTPEGGHIDWQMIQTGETDSTISYRFVVRDNGIGMSSDFLPHVFEAFKQESREVKAVGSGLGMPIVKQLIELMHGTIDLESELDVGTSITINLSFTKAEDKLLEDDSAIESIPMESLADKRILLCEDHPLNAQIATVLLKDKGMLVDWKNNGELGVEAFDKSKIGYYDVILMDIRMPVMDGIEAASKIRQLGRADAKTVPIIALSANAFEEDENKSREAGMNAHLPKPIVPEQLYKTLCKWLALTYNT